MQNSLYKYIRFIVPCLLTIVVGVLIALNLHTCERKDRAESIILQNEIAYNTEIDSFKNQSVAYIKTIEALENANDSISTKMKEIVRELKIQRSKLKAVTLVGSKATKTDTITFKDTIFREDFKVDTTLYDDWYKLDLSLAYPSKVVVSPTFRSEKYIVLHHKKEYMKKPHWFFLFRLFQKKHTIIKVDVVEKSPYMETDTLRHIEIIK